MVTPLGKTKCKLPKQIVRTIQAMRVTKEAFHYQLNCTSSRTNQVPEGTYVIIAPDELPAWSIDDLAEAYRTGDMPTEYPGADDK